MRVINAAAGIGLGRRLPDRARRRSEPGRAERRGRGLCGSHQPVRHRAGGQPSASRHAGRIEGGHLRFPPSDLPASAPRYDIVVYTRGSANARQRRAAQHRRRRQQASIVNNLLAQFKVINASTVGLAAQRVLRRRAPAVQHSRSRARRGYQRTTAGQHTLDSRGHGHAGRDAADYSRRRSRRRWTRRSSSKGPAGALHAMLLTDNNLPPGPGNARVRVVNASADVAALDVFVDFSKQISALPQNSGASSLELMADPMTGTTFQFSFNVAGTSQTRSDASGGDTDRHARPTRSTSSVRRPRCAGRPHPGQLIARRDSGCRAAQRGPG